MTFQAAIDEHFPGSIEESEYLKKTLAALAPKEFTADNTIACVSVCRDELCTPFQMIVRDVWGEAFNMSSLAGVTYCGRTAFGAAHAHSPTDHDKERYVYYTMAHIGIGPGGEIGLATRVGREGSSKACGALAAILGEIEAGTANLDFDTTDPEQSMLRHAILKRVGWGKDVDLVELTRMGAAEGLAVLEKMIELTVDPKKADYAVFNGVQVHGPEHKTYIWPNASYVVKDGNKSDVTIG